MTRKWLLGFGGPFSMEVPFFVLGSEFWFLFVLLVQLEGKGRFASR